MQPQENDGQSLLSEHPPLPDDEDDDDEDELLLLLFVPPLAWPDQPPCPNVSHALSQCADGG